MRVAARPGWLLLALLGACDHSAPFAGSGHEDLDGPREPGAFARLTYNAADDRTASWLPDGSGFLYSSEMASPDRDRCLLQMGANGGTVQRTTCDRRYAHDDSTDRFESPAASAAGRLLFLRAVSTIGLQKGPRTHLLLGRLDDPVAAEPFSPVPYFAPSGRTHGYAAFPAWLGDDEFVYLGQYLWYQGSTVFPDTFTTGLEVVRGTIASGVVSLAVVPGTDQASSVAAGDVPGTLIVTFGGDARVYRLDIATGAREVLWDFGAAGIARDASVRAGRLVAIVGRSVLYQEEDPHGFVQRDEGGDLHVVDLATGATQVRSEADVLFRRPALSPDGRRVVVEVSPFAPVHVGPLSDYNATNHRPDLWLLTLD